MDEDQITEYKAYIKKFFGVPPEHNPLYVDFDTVEKEKKIFF